MQRNYEKTNLEWLKEMEVSVQTFKNRKYLYCVKKIPSLYIAEYLQMVLDEETLEPVLPVFSSLRNTFIELTEKFTFEKLLAEEIHYKQIVDEFVFKSYDTQRQQGENILLTAFR